MLPQIPGEPPAWNGKRLRPRRCITLRRRLSSTKVPTTIPDSTRRRRVSEVRSVLAEQFDTLEQQHESSRLGLWTFLATEVLFFGGLFLAYIVYRHAYPHEFALASSHTNLFLGTLNTAVLLTSSLTMALAVQAAQQSRTRALFRFLAITLVLGFGFLVIKGLEYREHFADHLVPGPHFALAGHSKAQLFFWLYFVMTGLHAIHVTAG